MRGSRPRGVFRQPWRYWTQRRRRSFPTARAGQVITLGLAVESDTAPNLAIPIDLATETDTAFAVSGIRTAHLDLAIETDTAFGVTIPATEPAYGVLIDWNNDADFTDPGDDVTERVLARGNLTVAYGRDQIRALSPPAPGRAAFELNNQSRDYSPDNEDSPLFGLIEPGRPVWARTVLAATTYTLFRGHLDDFEIKPEPQERSVSVTALDPLAKLRDVKISTALYQGIRTGEAVDLILDQVGWPSADRDIDNGATIIPWWWEEGTDAFDALIKVINSEGPGAFVHADPDGKIVFRDRHHRLTRAVSKNAQATFADEGDEPLISKPYTYDAGWKEIINSVSFDVPVRAPEGVRTAVWESEQIHSLADAESLTIRAQANEPFIDAQLEFTLQTGTVSHSLARTSGQAIAFTITGVGAALVSSLRVTAYPVPVQRTEQILVEDSGSITAHGRRSYTPEVPWVGVHDARAVADLIIAQRAQRAPIVKFAVRGSNNSRLYQQFARDLSDRIHIREHQTAQDHDFYIEQIEHVISGGAWHVTTFGCERASVHPDNVFRFNTAGQGFNDGVFAQAGMDDPANLFRFDQAGQGFNDGVFAT